MRALFKAALALVAVAGLVTLGGGRPQAAEAQATTQVVSACPVAEAPNGVEVCVDRGPGATYAVGDPITICVTVNIPQIAIFPPPPPPTVRLTNILNNGASTVIFEDAFASGQRCISRRIAPPTGQESIRADVIGSDGRVIATDTVSYQTTGGPTRPVSVDITIDRGANAVYRVGEPIQVCVDVAPASGNTAYQVRLVNTVGNTARQAVDLGSFTGRRCTTLTVAPPTGAETLRAEVRATAGGQVLATDAVSFLTLGQGFPQQPPPSGQFAPAAPTNLRATATGPSSIRLDWNDASFNEDGFSIYTGEWVANVGPNTTTYTITGLALASYHCYYVLAFNEAGNSPTTDWACATTLTGGQPGGAYTTAALFLGDPRPCIPAQGSTQCSANRLALWNGDPAAWAARGVFDPNDRFVNVILFRIEAGDPATIASIARLLGAPYLQITRLHFAGASPEFVEITNLGGGVQSLNGWSVRASTTGAIFRFPAGVTLGPGQYCRVYTGVVRNDSCGGVAWNAANVWPDTGGAPVLFYDALNLLGDQTRYSADPNAQPVAPALIGVTGIDAEPVAFGE